RTTGAAHDRVFFDGHQQLVSVGNFPNQGFVQWLDETHVDYRRIEFVRDFQCCGQLHTEHQQSDVAALTANHAFADLNRFEVFLDGRIRAGAARVTHSGRAVVEVSGAEHFAQFVLVARGHHQHAGDAAQERQVETAGV